MSYKMFMPEDKKQDWRDRKPGPVAYLVSFLVLVGLSTLCWFFHNPTGGKSPSELYIESVDKMLDEMNGNVGLFIFVTVVFIFYLVALAVLDE